MKRIFSVILLNFTITLAFAAVSDNELQKYIENGDKAALIRALNSGVDVNLKIGKQQSPLVSIAVINGEDKIVKELVKRGADVNAKDAAGKTPLHHAATGSSSWVINYLTSKGADPGIKDKAGKYPLDHAKAGGDQGRIMQLNVAGMMANQKGGNAPTDIGGQQQKMMQRIMGGLQQNKTKTTKPAKGMSRNELAKILVGKWVNLKERHIITFHKNGRFEGARKKNILWSLNSGKQVSFKENKVSGFGFGKNVGVVHKDDKLIFAKQNDFAVGEYQRATPLLVAQVKAAKQKRKKILTNSMRKTRIAELSQKSQTSEFNATHTCNNCVLNILTGEEYAFSIAKNSDFSANKERIRRSLNLSWSDLRGSTFAGTRMTRVRFYYADLRKADFSGTFLRDVNFAYANLAGANFRNATIDMSMFTGANLTGADFTGAKIVDADFTFSNQTGWKFKAEVDAATKVTTTAQDKALAGLWVVKEGNKQINYLHIFDDGTYIRSDDRGKIYTYAGFIFTKDNRLRYRSASSYSSYSASDAATTFEVKNNRLRLFGKNGKSAQYQLATKADWKKYKTSMYRDGLMNMALKNQIAYFDKLFTHGFSFKEIKFYRQSSLIPFILGVNQQIDTQRASAYLMKMLVGYGMDYTTKEIRGNYPVVEAAARWQLESLRYLLALDKRPYVIDEALRHKDVKKNKKIVAILEKHKK